MVIQRYNNLTLILTSIFFFVLTFQTSIYSEEIAPSLDTAIVQKGKDNFTNKGCIACHTIGGGKLSGPDLLGVTKRREEQWLKKWLKSPDTMIYTDPIAKEMLKEFYVPMPNLGLTDEEIEQLIIYFKKNDKQVKN